jgi:hypothetical protein
VCLKNNFLGESDEHIKMNRNGNKMKGYPLVIADKGYPKSYTTGRMDLYYDLVTGYGVQEDNQYVLSKSNWHGRDINKIMILFLVMHHASSHCDND